MNFKNKQIFVYTSFMMLLFLSYSGASSFKLFQGLSASLSFPQSVLSIGANETVSAMVSGGNAPYTYEWSLNGEPVGRNSNLFTLEGNQSTLGYDNITLKVIDQYNNFAYVTNYVYIENPTFFTSYISPNYETADFGQNITFTVSTTSGTPPYTYDWNFISTNGNQTTLNCRNSYCNLIAAENGSVQATVIDSNGRVSSSVSSLTIVGSPISVTAYPYTVSIYPGYPEMLSAVASGGSGNFTYKWYNYTSGTGIIVTGATSNTLQLNSMFTPGHFEYYVIAYDQKASSVNFAKSNLIYITVINQSQSLSGTDILPYKQLINPICNIINISQGYSTTNTIYGNSFLISETLLTNNGAQISVDGTSYYLGKNQTEFLGTATNYSYYLKLLGIYGTNPLYSTLSICGSQIKTVVPYQKPTVQNVTSPSGGIPSLSIYFDNSSDTYLNQSSGASHIISAYSNYPTDKLAMQVNGNIIATGIGNVSFNTRYMLAGNYSVNVCDLTSIPEQCSRNISILVSPKKPTSGQFSLFNISIPIPPLYLGIIIGIIAIALVYTIYKRRSEDYDFMYGSKNNNNTGSNNSDSGSKTTAPSTPTAKNNDYWSNTSDSKKGQMKESSLDDDAPINISKTPKYYSSEKEDLGTNEKLDWSSESKE